MYYGLYTHVDGNVKEIHIAARLDSTLEMPYSSTNTRHHRLLFFLKWKIDNNNLNRLKPVLAIIYNSEASRNHEISVTDTNDPWRVGS